MSVRRTTTIHCDDCGEWEYGGDGESTSTRRKRGWKIWREPGYHRKSSGPIRHRCPKCVKERG